ncbi:SLAP domain-containing protein [Virgibacillus ndiopensis]|uniref:SLAP domain-containing protein n=1 Tax=Virgibacillus ndiopensis TaxID=2004408 RepID=UPI00159BD7D4|nr:SLAP domain-containing protein [Virgibacillus ndiopensis]
MQKLRFESSWDKTISTKDRNQIEQVFSDTQCAVNEPIYFSSLWQAINHKNQLLVTVLIHNTSQKNLSFQNTKMRYLENNEIVVEYSFTLPLLFVEPHTSMPWTFIFPVESLCHKPKLKNGKLDIVYKL